MILKALKLHVSIKGGTSMNASQLFIPLPELYDFKLLLQNSIEETTILTPLPLQPNLKQSKLAGYPYLPKNHLPIKDEQGHHMLLLAQLNFAEMDAPPFFPKDGILQFFISQHCYETYTNETLKKSYKIRYFPTILTHAELVTDFSYLHAADFSGFPIKYEQALAAYQQVEPVSATDYRLGHYINPQLLNKVITKDERTFSEIYLEHFLSAEHKIGGYPYFINQDIREENPPLQHYDTLLFQVVSNDAQHIMWGDSGVISFFINSKKLQQLDFSDVYFHAEDY